MRRWLPFTALVLLVFAFSATGRRIQIILKTLVGPEGMLLLAAAGTLLLGFGLIWWMRHRRLSPRAVRTAFVLFSVLFGSVLVLRDNPEEAFHFLEYGLLGYAALHALAPERRNLRHFFVAALLASTVGAVEECLQGFLPGRFFDLRDIRFNMEAACLTQIILAAMTYRDRERS